MREIILGRLEVGTCFEYNGTTYVLGNDYKDGKCQCFPFLGGKVQRKFDDRISANEVVMVSAAGTKPE